MMHHEHDRETSPETTARGIGGQPLGGPRSAPRSHHSGRRLSRRTFVAAGTAAAGAMLAPAALAQSVNQPAPTPTRFRRISTQFIAALAPPGATAGDNAEQWGLWRRDPGPRGVALRSYDLLKAAGGVAPAQWQLDDTDWWLEEHGLIMEQPEFPLAAGQYVVTGDREATTVLTVHPADANGSQRWELADDVTLYDVTHLRCRSARYTPAAGHGACTPASARQSDFPVAPGAEMPPVTGCNKQDYAVLFVIGVAVEG